MEHLHPDDCAEHFTSKLLDWMGACIPLRTVRDRKSTHPWLTEAVLEKVEAKQKAAGTELEKAAAEACSAEAKKAYKEYVQRVRDELLTLQKNSKKLFRTPR